MAFVSGFFFVFEDSRAKKSFKIILVEWKQMKTDGTQDRMDVIMNIVHTEKNID